MSNPNGNKQSLEHKQPEEQQKELIRQLNAMFELEEDYRAWLRHPTNVLAQMDDGVVRAFFRDTWCRRDD